MYQNVEQIREVNCIYLKDDEFSTFAGNAAESFTNLPKLDAENVISLNKKIQIENKSKL